MILQAAVNAGRPGDPGARRSGEAQGGRNDAIPMADAIREILDRADVKAPRLQHGDGELTWILIEDAVRRGLDTRVGLEDNLYLPDGARARGNADLAAAARDLGAGARP